MAEIIGTVVATEKDPNLLGITLLIVQPLDEERLPKGSPIVAADTVGIGVGELGLCTGGREAAMALPKPFVPVDCAVVGIVDNLDVEREKIS